MNKWLNGALLVGGMILVAFMAFNPWSYNTDPATAITSSPETQSRLSRVVPVHQEKRRGKHKRKRIKALPSSIRNMKRKAKERDAPGTTEVLNGRPLGVMRSKQLKNLRARGTHVLIDGDQGSLATPNTEGPTTHTFEQRGEILQPNTPAPSAPDTANKEP